MPFQKSRTFVAANTDQSTVYCRRTVIADRSDIFEHRPCSFVATMHPQHVAVLLLGAFATSCADGINIPTRTIAPGVEMPVISIGTWLSSKGEDAYTIVSNWLKLGGRGIDSALIYFDQKSVAKAISDAGLTRADVFITSKVPACATDPYLTKRAVQADLHALGTEYIDLLLIHAPLGVGCRTTWHVLEDLHLNGTLRSIGVSNFGAGPFFRTLEKLCGREQDECKVPIALNQIDYNVFKHDETTIRYCREHNITVQAYSPLGGTKSTHSVFHDQTVLAIAKQHNVTAAQVALRWIVQRGDILTVLSGSSAHQAADARLWTFALAPDEMNALDHLKNVVEEEEVER